MIFGNTIIFEILLLVLLLGVNAFFASSEIAIISLNDNKIKKLAEKGVIEGTTDLDAVKKCLKSDLPVEEYDTLSGFLIGQLGRIPSEGEKPTIEFNGLVFKVKEIEEKRISKIKVCKA